MSGSTDPGLGLVIKLVIAVAVLLALEYILVVVKLVRDSDPALTWRVIIGVATPLLLILAWFVSERTNEKTINIATVFFLAYANLVYLLSPLSFYLADSMSGGNRILASTLLVAFLILVPLLTMAAVVALLFFVLSITSAD